MMMVAIDGRDYPFLSVSFCDGILSAKLGLMYTGERQKRTVAWPG